MSARRRFSDIKKRRRKRYAACDDVSNPHEKDFFGILAVGFELSEQVILYNELRPYAKN